MNNTLFNNLRFWTYPTVKHYLNNHAGFIAAVEEQAYKEVLSTATSVSGYTWRNRFGEFRRKRIMQLPEDMPQKTKGIFGSLLFTSV